MAFHNVTATPLIHLIKDHESKKDFSSLWWQNFPMKSVKLLEWLLNNTGIVIHNVQYVIVQWDLFIAYFYFTFVYLGTR